MRLTHASVWRVEATFGGGNKPGRAHYCAAVIAGTAEEAAAEVRVWLEAQHQCVAVHSVTRPISGRCIVHVARTGAP